MAVEFKQATLANGLDVVAEVDPSAHTAAIGFFVKTGARDEDPAVMGVSHFLEHMMFKGTDTRSAEQVDKDFDDIGADHNAYTSGEMTAFWAHALPEHLPREIVGDDPTILPQKSESALSGYEKALIVKALKENDWNQTRAAEQLQITRRALKLKMDRYAIQSD